MAPATGEAKPAIAQEKKSDDANNDENGVVKFSLPVPISSVDEYLKYADSTPYE